MIMFQFYVYYPPFIQVSAGLMTDVNESNWI